MANAIAWSRVFAKDRRSQFCFDYGKQEGEPADHTIHLEIKNFLEFTRNESNTVLTTGYVDIQGCKWFVRAYMSTAPNPSFIIAVCSLSEEPPLVTASLQLLLSTDMLTTKL